MILYNVTVNVEDSVHDVWLQWMREEHIPEVMHTGLFMGKRMLRLLTEDDSEGKTYAIQYFCENMEKYNLYQEKYAPALQKNHHQKFGTRCVAFRTLLEVVE